jgi:hypothetical protein
LIRAQQNTNGETTALDVQQVLVDLSNVVDDDDVQAFASSNKDVLAYLQLLEEDSA